MMKLSLLLAIVAIASAQTDGDSQCASWKTSGYCNNAYVQTTCPVSCAGVTVSTPTTVTTPVTTPVVTGVCTADTESATQCTSWKNSGYCNNQHVQTTCCKTCGAVATTPVVVNTVTAAPTPVVTAAPTFATVDGICVDYHTNAAECANWKTLGYCTFPAWSKWMNQMCHKTCSSCETFRCMNVETEASCLTSAASGQCTDATWGAWMTKNCKKACGLCQPRGQNAEDCSALTHTQLLVALSVVTCGEPECESAITASKVSNGAATPKHSWGAYVNRAGMVCSVVSTGPSQNDQSPFGRLEALVKANTANDFSSNGFAMSSANAYGYAIPGGSLHGAGAATPVNAAATSGLVSAFGFACGNGIASDGACGLKIGGFSPSGGAVPLYDADGVIVGALGVGGDDACVSHNIAWKVRKLTGLHKATMTDNIVYPTATDTTLANTNKHPNCGAAAQAISDAF
jgi:hypothetical protein